MNADPAVDVTPYLADGRHFTLDQAPAWAVANEMLCPISALLAGFPL